jgi:ribonuclease HII
VAYLIGTDEAGYGPNLGPLVITAASFRIAEEAVGPVVDDGAIDLYHHLSSFVRRDLRDSPLAANLDLPGAAEVPPVVIADSKLLYKPRQSLCSLERGVLGMLGSCGKPYESWQTLWAELGADIDGAVEDPGVVRVEAPWHADYDRPLPLDAAASDVQRAAALLRLGWQTTSVAPGVVRSRAIFPAGFNRRVACEGNKATVLSRATLELVYEIVRSLPGDEAVFVSCDKHGGRSRYAALLSQCWPDDYVSVRRETPGESVYRIGAGPAIRQVAFRAGGESHLASAFASMVSKYLRELAMRAFNDFWQKYLPELKPTAGYPLDARRFRQDVAGVQRKLGIADHCVWRDR